MFRAPFCPSEVHDDSVGDHVGCLVLELVLVRSYVQAGWMSFRTEGCNITHVEPNISIIKYSDTSANE